MIIQRHQLQKLSDNGKRKQYSLLQKLSDSDFKIAKHQPAIKGLTEEKFRSLHVYNRREVDSIYEGKIFTAFNGFSGRPKPSASDVGGYFYSHSDFNDGKFNSRRITNKPGSEAQKYR